MRDWSGLRYNRSSMKTCPVLARSVNGGGERGVEEQGIQVQDEQQGGHGAALPDTSEPGVTEGPPPPPDEGCVQGVAVKQPKAWGELMRQVVVFKQAPRCGADHAVERFFKVNVEVV